MGRRIVIGLLVVVLIAAVGFFAIAHRAAIAPIEPPSPTRFTPALVATGERLVAAGNCASCHTTKGGEPFAGGLGLDSGFGTIYSTNITPDPETGIGRWSEQAFARALSEGVARDGSHLFPAFPYDHFTKVRADDVAALYAYLMTRAPVKAAAKPDALPFPLNIRALQAGWKLLFFSRGEFQPDPQRSAEWNRGAYLSEGLAHCGACHTPRNRLGAERGDALFAGAMIEGWYAPAIGARPTAPVPWSVDELYGYLRNGGTALHGSAAGSMSEVVHASLARLADADVRAIATYFAARGSNAATASTAGQAVAQALARRGGSEGGPVPGEHLYVAACESCHYNAGAPMLARPALALNSALTAPDAANLVHVILEGIGRDDGLPRAYMPGFAQSLSDTEIARLAAYLRRTRTDQPAWPDLEATVARIRAGKS